VGVLDGTFYNVRPPQSFDKWLLHSTYPERGECEQALEAEGHQVYLPQRDTPATQEADRTTTTFYTNLAALRKADAVVAVCDGSQVDDGTAWEIGYAYGKKIQIFGLRTDARIGQRADEPINLMILESLSELSPTIEQLVHTIRYAEQPRMTAATCWG
jgi:nucleoside 2-deoxyribosyltransferase